MIETIKSYVSDPIFWVKTALAVLMLIFVIVKVREVMQSRRQQGRSKGQPVLMPATQSPVAPAPAPAAVAASTRGWRNQIGGILGGLLIPALVLAFCVFLYFFSKENHNYLAFPAEATPARHASFVASKPQARSAAGDKECHQAPRDDVSAPVGEVSEWVPVDDHCTPVIGPAPDSDQYQSFCKTRDGESHDFSTGECDGDYIAVAFQKNTSDESDNSSLPLSIQFITNK